MHDLPSCLIDNVDMDASASDTPASGGSRSSAG